MWSSLLLEAHVLKRFAFVLLTRLADCFMVGPMLKTITFLVGAGLLFAGVLAIPVHADSAPPIAAPVVQPAMSAPSVVPQPPHLSEEEIARQEAAADRHDRLTHHVLSVMLGWRHAAFELPVVDHTELARDIATAVINEPLTFDELGGVCRPIASATDGFRHCKWRMDGSWSTDGSKAVLLTAVAYWEGSRYLEYVDNGDCNNKIWRKSPEGARLMHMGGDCDGGHAYSLLQIHPITNAKNVLGKLCGHKAVAGSRAGAFRCGLEMMRRSMTVDGTLSEYTGESLYGDKHPKADERLNFAKDALRNYPWSGL
jgi:hypothetical protein